MSISSFVTPSKLESIWKNKSFNVLFGSVLLLTFGNQIYQIVIPLIMYDLTHSSVTMASMRTAELLPNFFFAMLIGVIVDKVNKKIWVMWMIGLQAILLFTFVYMYKSNNHILFLYYTIGFWLLTCNYGYFNAQVSLTKLIVPVHQLTSANAKLTFAETFITVMGPALTGLILLLPDMSDGVLITAICYLLSLFICYRISVFETNRATKSNFLQDLREGWHYFSSNRILRVTTLFVIFLNCTTTVVSTTIIFFAKDILHVPSSLLAIVLSMSGIGGIVGSVYASKLRTQLGLGKLFGISAGLDGIAFLLLFFSKDIVMLSIALLLSGFAGSLNSIAVYTFRHEQTTARLMGRIAGITGTLWRTGMPITMYLSGWMIVWWGSKSIFISAAVLNGIVFLFLTRTRIWSAQ